MVTILGIVFGSSMALLLTGVLFVIRRKKSMILLLLNLLAGGVGAVSSNQLLVYGPDLMGLSIIPMLAGSLVLASLVSYSYYHIVK